MSEHRQPLGMIPLSTAGLDRRAVRRSTPGLVAALLADEATRVLPIVGSRAPGASGGRRPALPNGTSGVTSSGTAPGARGRRAVDGEGSGPRLAWRAPEVDDTAYEGIFLGEGGGHARVALLVPHTAAEADWVSLRGEGADLAPLDADAFATAVALANWHATHTHCPRCGTPTEVDDAGWTRRCPADASAHFPRTDPAVIMAVLDPDDRLLIARHPSWPPGRLSVLAGFVEPGESLEMAVCREVKEEVGLTVSQVRYLGDQPWPFPNSIMLGFEAQADDTELTLDPGEIAEAFWVTRAQYCAKVDDGAWGGGTALSISRRLIQRWLAQPGG